jgi:crotonobetainyl-CoA:carnitine CoA-transferase CaiB-like acyl-CoA transferase
MNYLVGYEGRPALGMNLRYGDSSAGAAGAYAALVALMHRERTGEGQFVDVSAVECMASLVGDRLFEYSLTGQIPQPDGNTHPVMAPHGAYPSRDGSWISIAVEADAEWRALCATLGAAGLAEDPRYASLPARRANLAALDEALAGLTRDQDPAALAARLRAAGVAAWKSLTTLDLVEDKELWRRGFYVNVSGAGKGVRPSLGAPWQFSRTQAEIAKGAPKLGEHNAYVYCDLLGRSPSQLEALIREGVVD